jgi:hypothetical protein
MLGGLEILGRRVRKDVEVSNGRVEREKEWLMRGKVEVGG